jgi:hypothetical protein
MFESALAFCLPDAPTPEAPAQPVKVEAKTTANGHHPEPPEVKVSIKPDAHDKRMLELQRKINPYWEANDRLLQMAINRSRDFRATWSEYSLETVKLFDLWQWVLIAQSAKITDENSHEFSVGADGIRREAISAILYSQGVPVGKADTYTLKIFFEAAEQFLRHRSLGDVSTFSREAGAMGSAAFWHWYHNHCASVECKKKDILHLISNFKVSDIYIQINNKHQKI